MLNYFMENQQYSKGNFIGMLLYASDYFFIYRNSASGLGSYSIYIHLEKLEKEIRELTQELIFLTQNDEGFIEVIVPSSQITEEQLSIFVEKLFKYIDINKGIFITYQLEIINKIQILLSKTNYALKYLK